MSTALALVARGFEVSTVEASVCRLTEVDLDLYVRPIIALYKLAMGTERKQDRDGTFRGGSRRARRTLTVWIDTPDSAEEWHAGQFSWIESGAGRSSIGFAPDLRIDHIRERFPWAGIKTKADALAVLTLHELGHFHDQVRGLGLDALDMTQEARVEWYRRVERDADRHATRWWKARRFPVRGRRSAALSAAAASAGA